MSIINYISEIVCEFYTSIYKFMLNSSNKAIYIEIRICTQIR